MIVVMRHRAGEEEIAEVLERVESLGFQAHLSRGVERTIIGLIGDERRIDPGTLEILPGVERVMPVLYPFKLAGRDFHPEDSLIPLDGFHIGAERVVVMAGPCAVESAAQIREAAWRVKEAGASLLRGGAYKPRTSPYSFQGLGEDGLRLLKMAGEEAGLPVISEVMSEVDVPLVAEYADVLQIGARNMQNQPLLRAVGRSHRPVLLKRGPAATVEELLLAAEYVLVAGNRGVILCERGIRTFETYTRNTLDINAIPLLKSLSHLPVIADPSHGAGRWDLVEAVSRAAVAAGADGLLVEVHPHPEAALSDGAQSLRPERFASLMDSLRRVAGAVGRSA